MATAAVLSPSEANNGPIKDLNEKAQTFLNVVPLDLKQDPDTSTGETKEVTTFILNSEDFINLQIYLQAGIKLPPTPAIFETIFPEASINKFIKSREDTEFYNVCNCTVKDHFCLYTDVSYE